MTTKLTLTAALLTTLTIGCAQDGRSNQGKDHGPTLQDDAELTEEGELEEGDLDSEVDLGDDDLDEAVEEGIEEDIEEELEEDIEEELDEEELDEDIDEEEAVEEEPPVDREFASIMALDMRTYDQDDETDAYETTCQGSFLVHVSADGAVTGEATCMLENNANVLFAELDAEVVGSSIVGEILYTYNRQEIVMPIDGIFAEDRLWIDLEVEYNPTSQLTNHWEGSIEGTL
jgi:hypothetical protein